jgi:hypothetical protein
MGALLGVSASEERGGRQATVVVVGVLAREVESEDKWITLYTSCEGESDIHPSCTSTARMGRRAVQCSRRAKGRV